MKIDNIIPIEILQRRLSASSETVSVTIAIKRPKWNDVYQNYPKNDTNTNDIFGPDFYKKLFGARYDLKTNLLDNKTHLYNGCAGKVSTALVLSGSPLTKTSGIGIDFVASEDILKSKTIKDLSMKSKGFISTASKMKKWLDAAWKTNGDFHVDNPTSVNDLKALTGDKQGIYLMLAKNTAEFGASGHVTLWTNNASEKYVFGGHHYEKSAKAMYFWELK